MSLEGQFSVITVQLYDLTSPIRLAFFEISCNVP